MWGYDGPNDLTRTRRVDFTNEELEYHIRLITTVPKSEPCAEKPPVAPYGQGRYLAEVNFLPLLFHLLSCKLVG